MTWLEDLLLILLLECHAVIDILVPDLDPVDGLILAHWINIFLDDIAIINLVGL